MNSRTGGNEAVIAALKAAHYLRLWSLSLLDLLSWTCWNQGVGRGGGRSDRHFRHYARLRKAKVIRPSIVWTRERNGRGRRSAWKRRDEAIVSLTNMETVSKATFGEPRKDRAVERVWAFAKRIDITQTHELNRTAAHLLSRLQTRHRDRQTDRDRETDRRRKKEEEKRKKPTAFLLACFAELTEKQKTVSMVTERERCKRNDVSTWHRHLWTAAGSYSEGLCLSDGVLRTQKLRSRSLWTRSYRRFPLCLVHFTLSLCVFSPLLRILHS